MSQTEIIIEKLEEISLFENRYSEMKCINYDKDTKSKEGFFSLVFTATDTILEEDVIIKFFDPDHFHDQYRLKCFEREAKILKKLLTKPRCLQLKKEMNEYLLEIELSEDKVLPFKLLYFVTEQLPISIIDMFYKEENTYNLTLERKLIAFRQIVLSVKAIHDYEVFHRDLKPDNFRGYIKELKIIAVAIDFGTAVHSKLQNLGAPYPSYVGHTGYTSPEAFVGLCGDREIDFFTDYYSLGCMLYELFSYELLFHQIKVVNQNTYFPILAHCRNAISASKNKRKDWDTLLDEYKKDIKYPSLKSKTEIPLSIHTLLNKLLRDLLLFDYRDRLTDLDEVIRRVDTSLKILRNESYEKYLTEKKRKYKKNRKIRLETIRQKYCLSGVVENA